MTLKLSFIYWVIKWSVIKDHGHGSSFVLSLMRNSLQENVATFECASIPSNGRSRKTVAIESSSIASSVVKRPHGCHLVFDVDGILQQPSARLLSSIRRGWDTAAILRGPSWKVSSRTDCRRPCWRLCMDSWMPHSRSPETNKYTMVENRKEHRCKYWATCLSVRSFARTTHSFAYSRLLASLAPSAALARGTVNDWMAIYSVFFFFSSGPWCHHK